MEWVPPSAWLTKLQVDSRAADLAYDLAIDASGQGTPSQLAAGLDPVQSPLQLQGLDGPGGLALVLLGLPLALALRRLALSR
jgi:hypothetical protein